MIQKRKQQMWLSNILNKEEVEKQVANNTKELETKLVEQQNYRRI